jgi:hypothetical protein
MLYKHTLFIYSVQVVFNAVAGNIAAQYKMGAFRNVGTA